MNTSKKISTVLKALSLGVIMTMAFGLTNINTAQAQEVTTGVDLYSTYVWRGVAYSGPSLQPAVEFSSGGFAIGAWGSQGYDGFQEMDLYAGYSFDFGLSLGVTDYYYPGTLWLDGDSHAIEINAGYSADAFSLSGNFIVNEAAGAGSAGGDLYFEAGYAFSNASIFLGGGDGWHSSDGEFALVNLGISTGKDIVITDTFTIPLSGAVIFNPDTEQLYILAGLSF